MAEQKRPIQQKLIGIVYKQKVLEDFLKGRESYEQLHFYEELAKQYGIDLFLYSKNQFLRHKLPIFGLYYDHESNLWKRRYHNLPKINMMRTNLYQKEWYRRLKQIEAKKGVQFLNLVPERNKYEIHQHLEQVAELREYLPRSAPLTYPKLKQFLEEVPKVVLKPIDGALGEKIFVIEKEEAGYRIQVHYHKQPYQQRISAQQLFRFYRQYFPNPKKYFIQEWIPFQTNQGDKFDIRTSVQKNKDGEWVVSGLVVRLAGQAGIVTNLAQGGQALSFSRLPLQSPQDLEQQLVRLSLQVAVALEKLYPGTVDLGLDIGLDQNHKLWFIEANYCDQRISYYYANEHHTWKRVYQIPFEYAYRKCVHSS